MKKPKTNIFDFFSRLQIPLAIDTGCYKDKIKGAIMKDYKEFDWSNINSFDLVENCENITEACTPPVVNRLYNFKETLFFNSNIDEEVKNINTCNGSSVEELNKFIRVFIISEIKGFDKIKEDLKLLQAELGIDRKILDDLIKCHDCILGKIRCMICKCREVKIVMDNSNEYSCSVKHDVAFDNNNLNQDNRIESTNSFVPSENSTDCNFDKALDDLFTNSSDINLDPKLISQIYLDSYNDLLIYVDFARERV